MDFLIPFELLRYYVSAYVDQELKEAVDKNICVHLQITRACITATHFCQQFLKLITKKTLYVENLKSLRNIVV